MTAGAAPPPTRDGHRAAAALPALGLGLSCGLLGVAAHAGAAAFLVTVVGLQLLLAGGWIGILTARSSPAGHRAGLADMAAPGAAALAANLAATQTSRAGPLVAGLLAGVAVALVHQILRRDPRADMVRGLMVELTAAVLMVTAALLVQVRAAPDGPQRVAATLAGVGAAVVVALLLSGRALHAGAGLRLLLGLVAGTAAGVLAAGAGLRELGLVLGLAGAAAGLAAAVGLADSRGNQVARTATVPVVAAVPLVLLLTSFFPAG